MSEQNKNSQMENSFASQSAMLHTNMSANQDISGFSEAQIAEENARFMQRVYGWMGVALAISGVTAWVVSANESLWMAIAPFFTLLIILELVLVFSLSFLVNKVNSFVAMLMFVVYSFLTGLTLSVIFLVYELSSIVSIFGVTAGIFVALSIYGYTTKRDLTKIGTIATFGLLGIIVVSLINYFFLKSDALSTVTAAIGVLVFVVLTAYDTQKIKEMNVIGNE